MEGHNERGNLNRSVQLLLMHLPVPKTVARPTPTSSSRARDRRVMVVTGRDPAAVEHGQGRGCNLWAGRNGSESEGEIRLGVRCCAEACGMSRKAREGGQLGG